MHRSQGPAGLVTSDYEAGLHGRGARRAVLPKPVGFGCPPNGRSPVLELVYTGILVLAFAFIGWFSFYVVYKLYQGQR